MTLRYGHSRADGFRFIRYYKRNGKVYEEWASPARFIKSPRRKIDPSKNVQEEIRQSYNPGTKVDDSILSQARRLVYAAIMRGEISFK